MSSLIPTIEPTKTRSLASWLPRLLLALGASVLLAGCFTAVGAPVWLSAAIGALGGARIAASGRLSTVAPRR
jgi:hypothetical protein